MKRRRATPEDYDGITCLGQVIRLNKLPLEVPPDAAVVYLGRSSSGGVLVLGTVDNIKKLPKRLKASAQTVLPFWEQSCEQLCLVTSSGKIYAVAHS